MIMFSWQSALNFSTQRSSLLFIPYLVLHGALVQRVQLSVQHVHLVTNVIHLSTETLITGQVRVKLPLVPPALLV